MMRTYRRREFLGLGGVAAAAALAAACGDDDDDGDGATPASGATPGSGATPSITTGADNSAVGLRWFGQAMFQLTSPGGASVVLDPFHDIGYTLPPPIEAAAATITHEHPDHNNEELAATGAVVLRGLTEDGWADIDQNVGGVRIHTVRSFHDAQQGSTFGRNAVFVFEAAGMRFVHCGDLGHMFDEEQLAAIGGPVDVLMVPVGGTFTIDAAGATALMTQLSPKLVFPMHYATARTTVPIATADGFLEGKTVERVGSTTTRIAKDALPAAATVMVLDFE
jgi:L-ascorbate metabolism protein UlaG (beta-lactamase superfamily)